MIITRQGEYNNYYKSKFSASKSAIILEDAPAERNKETMATIKTELDNAPSLANYDYRAWDEDMRSFVNDVLRMYLNPGESIAAITGSAKKEEKPAPAKVAETAGSATTTASTDSKVSTDDDLDSFLNDLDI